MGTLNTIEYNIVYVVKKVNDLISSIIPHFDNHPILTKKNNEDLEKLLSIKASLNLGLSEKRIY